MSPYFRQIILSFIFRKLTEQGNPENHNTALSTWLVQETRPKEFEAFESKVFECTNQCNATIGNCQEGLGTGIGFWNRGRCSAQSASCCFAHCYSSCAGPHRAQECSQPSDTRSTSDNRDGSPSPPVTASPTSTTRRHWRLCFTAVHCHLFVQISLIWFHVLASALWVNLSLEVCVRIETEETVTPIVSFSTY